LIDSAVGELARNRSSAELILVVTSDCKVTGHKVYGSQLKRPNISFLARTKSFSSEGSRIHVRVPIRILGNFKKCADLGSVIKVSGRFIETKEKRVAGTLIASSELEVLEPASAFSKFLSGIRADFRKRASDLGGDAGALIPGMILGDTSLQSELFTSQMRRAGLSHLTAVSGANFAIVSALVFYLFRGVVPKIIPRLTSQMRRAGLSHLTAVSGANFAIVSALVFYLFRGVVPRIIPRLILTSIFLVIFLLLVRPSPSVLRAGVMAAVVLLSKASGSARNSVAALATAIAVLLLLDPFQAVDPGFVLSVLATSGLIFIAPRITEKLKQFLPEWLAEIIAIPCAATITCTPYDSRIYRSSGPSYSIYLRIPSSHRKGLFAVDCLRIRIDQSCSFVGDHSSSHDYSDHSRIDYFKEAFLKHLCCIGSGAFSH